MRPRVRIAPALLALPLLLAVAPFAESSRADAHLTSTARAAGVAPEQAGWVVLGAPVLAAIPVIDDVKDEVKDTVDDLRDEDDGGDDDQGDGEEDSGNDDDSDDGNAVGDLVDGVGDTVDELTGQEGGEVTAEAPAGPAPAGGVVPVAPGAASGTSPAASLPDPAPPEVGRRFNAAPVGGIVLVKPPDAPDYATLVEPAQLPVGSLLDTSQGSVSLTSARDGDGETQTLELSGGVFRTVQQAGPEPYTELVLAGPPPSGCRGSAARAARFLSTQSAASRPRRRSRGLWGKGKGRFRTRGRHGSASVRGTEWLTEDRCGGTFFTVREGTVDVRDFGRRRTVTLGAGASYLARVRRGRP